MITISLEVFQFLYFISVIFWFAKISGVMFFYFIRIKKWKKIEGDVKDSNTIFLRSTFDSDYEGWQEFVVYIYEVDSIIYENNVITKNLRALMPFKDFSTKYNFKKGEKIIITYNPDNPNESVLEDKFDYRTIFISIFIFTFIYIIMQIIFASNK